MQLLQGWLAWRHVLIQSRLRTTVSGCLLTLLALLMLMLHLLCFLWEGHRGAACLLQTLRDVVAGLRSSPRTWCCT
jgi:hypothetical protein